MNTPASLSAAGDPAWSAHAQQRGLLLAGIWFGIFCGFLEGVVQLAGQAWLDCKYVSADILWVAPCLYALVFGLAGYLLAQVSLRVMPARAHVPVFLGFVFLIVLMPLVALLQGLVAMPALLVLAFGLTVVIVRLMLPRAGAMLRMIRRTTAWMIGAALLAALLIPTGKHYIEASALARLPAPRSGTPNIVLVVLDALRADHVSALGYPRDTTPWLNDFVKQGIFYPWAYAASSWSLPSHVSLLTGNTFRQNDVGWYNHQGLRTYPGPVLPEVLRDHGYRTGAFPANIFWVTHDRLGRGFLHFDDFFYNWKDSVLRTMYGRAFEKYVMQPLGYEDIPARRHAADINRSFLEWLDQKPDHPFFALLNYMDVHDPYLPPEPYRTRFSPAGAKSGVLNWRVGRSDIQLTPAQREAEIAAYDGGLAYMDEQLKKLYGALQQRGLTNTIFVVTSDHGESFDEHGFYLHGHDLDNEELHVPLLLVWPGHIPAGLRPSYPVSNAALPATLLELCRIDNPLRVARASLAHWDTAPQPGQVTAYVEQTPWVPKGSPAYTGSLSSLIQDEWQLILPEHDKPRLFRVRSDPLETENLAAEHPDLEQQMKQVLHDQPVAPAH